MELVPLITEEWIEIGMQAQDAGQAIRKLGKRLVDDGCVSSAYIDEVIEREAVFPTGLPTEGVSVALPHASAEHVSRSSLAIAVLNQPVTFQEMGSPDQTLAVKIIFLLAVQDPANQVPALQQLVELFQDGVTLLKLSTIESRETAYKALLDGLQVNQKTTYPEQPQQP